MTTHISTVIDPDTGREVGLDEFGGVHLDHLAIGAVVPAPSTPGEWGFVAADGRASYGYGTREEAALRGPLGVGGFAACVAAVRG